MRRIKTVLGVVAVMAPMLVAFAAPAIGGDNSNQTVGTQGVANTGNAQNQIGVIDAGGFGDFDNNNAHGFFRNNGSDFEFDDVGSTIEVSPTNTTSSDQQVNQAATAFGK